MNTEAFCWKDGLFYQNGAPYSMISGEFHYFRVPKADWRDRLKKWKAAGGNTVATYIPWLIHEPKEGSYSFSQHDYDDLEGFLRVCQEENVQLVVRPGPYQYSELKWSGLPEWLCRNYPELLAKNLDGNSFSPSSISYTHPLFLEKAEKWFRTVCPILAKWTVSKGGPIVAVQLDNEAVGIHTWFNDGWYDYNPQTFGFGNPEGRWPQFLQNRYHTVEKLSETWECPVTSFASAMPICRTAKNRGDVRRIRDYEQCYLLQVADYFQILRGWMEECGLDVPFIHNSPNPEANANFFEVVEKMGENFLLGSDHYYNLNQNWAQNNPTPQYAVRNYVSLEILRNMGMPPTVLEMPSGSASDWPPILPLDAKAAYLTNLAMGLKGWNYYIYTGGPNVPGTGSTTDLYDYGAPVSATGECRPLYYAQKEVHELCRDYHLEESRLLSDFSVGYDHEMLRANAYWGFQEAGFFTPKEAWDATQKGVLTTAFCSGLTPQLWDLTQKVPDISKPMVLITGTVLSKSAQQNAAEFLKQGGRLLMGPELPILDENLNPCQILAEAVGITPEMFTREDGGILDMETVPNIMVEHPVSIKKEGALENLVRIRENGHVISARFVAGKGQVLWNGFAWTHGRHEHNAALEQLLASLGVKPILEKSEKNLFAVVHAVGDHWVLFVLNLYSSPLETTLTVHTPAGSVQLETLRLNPMEVRVQEIKI